MQIYQCYMAVIAKVVISLLHKTNFNFDIGFWLYYMVINRQIWKNNKTTQINQTKQTSQQPISHKHPTMNLINVASSKLKAAILYASSSENEVDHPPSNVLDERKDTTWISGQGLPQFLIITLQEVQQRYQNIVSVSITCTHDYQTNPKKIEIWVASSQQQATDEQFIHWKDLAVAGKAGTQIFSIESIPQAFRIIKVMITETYGEYQTYLNQVCLFAEPESNSMSNNINNRTQTSQSLFNQEDWNQNQAVIGDSVVNKQESELSSYSQNFRRRNHDRDRDRDRDRLIGRDMDRVIDREIDRNIDMNANRSKDKNKNVNNNRLKNRGNTTNTNTNTNNNINTKINKFIGTPSQILQLDDDEHINNHHQHHHKHQHQHQHQLLQLENLDELSRRSSFRKHIDIDNGIDGDVDVDGINTYTHSLQRQRQKYKQKQKQKNNAMLTISKNMIVMEDNIDQLNRRVEVLEKKVDFTYESIQRKIMRKVEDLVDKKLYRQLSERTLHEKIKTNYELGTSRATATNMHKYGHQQHQHQHQHHQQTTHTNTNKNTNTNNNRTKQRMKEKNKRINELTKQLQQKLKERARKVRKLKEKSKQVSQEYYL